MQPRCERSPSGQLVTWQLFPVATIILALAIATAVGSGTGWIGESASQASDTESTGVNYAAPESRGQLDDPILESSGLARSWRYAGACWTHNDSGNDPLLFLLGASGNTLATVEVQAASCVDWEDICSFRHQEKNYLLVGDVGDNGRRRSHVVLHLIEEPDVPLAAGQPPQPCRPLRSVSVQYADGPRDCEAVAVDPSSETIFLFTKTLAVNATVFKLPLAEMFAEEPEDSMRTAQRASVCRLPLITAADISADGRRLVCATYTSVGQWVRSADESWEEVLSDSQPRTWVTAPRRRQGEAICYDQDDRSLLLTSEGRRQSFWCIPARN